MTPSDFKAARAAMGLTQRQLAERLGMTTRAVQYWEHGKRRIPQVVEVLMTYIHGAIVNSASKS